MLREEPARTGENVRLLTSPGWRLETLHVQFGFDRSDLSDGAQTALLQITKELRCLWRVHQPRAGATDVVYDHEQQPISTGLSASGPKSNREPNNSSVDSTQ